MELLEETRKNEIFQIHESQSDDSYDAGLLNDFSIKKEVYDSSRKLFNKVLLKGNNDSVKEFNDWIYKQIELDTGASEPSSTDIEGFATKLDVEVSPMQKLFKLDLGLMTMEYRFKCGEWQGNTKKSGVTNPVGTKYFITFTDSRLTSSPRVLQIPKWLIDKPEVPNAPTGAEYSVIVGNPDKVEAEHNFLTGDPIEKGDDVFYRRKSVNKDTAKIEYWEPGTQEWKPSTWFKKSDETAYHYPDEGFLYKTGEYTEGDGDAPIQGGPTADGQGDKYFHLYKPPFPVGLNEFVGQLQKHYIDTLSDLYLDAVDINTIKVVEQRASTDLTRTVTSSEPDPEQWGIKYLTSNKSKPLNKGKVTQQNTGGRSEYVFEPNSSGIDIWYVFWWGKDTSDLSDEFPAGKEKWLWKYQYRREVPKAEEDKTRYERWISYKPTYEVVQYPRSELSWYNTRTYPAHIGWNEDANLAEAPSQVREGWRQLPPAVGTPTNTQSSRNLMFATTHIRILDDIMHGKPFVEPKVLHGKISVENIRYPHWYDD
jgi:hypothetical protein